MTPSPTPPTIVATISDPVALTDALRARAEVINRSRLELDALAGLADGYCAKVLAPKPLRQMGVESLCRLVAALGCDLALVENEGYMMRIAERSPPRVPGHANHAGAVHLVFSLRHLRTIARIGGQNSRAYMSRREARILARKAAAIRWSKEPAP